VFGGEREVGQRRRRYSREEHELSDEQQWGGVQIGMTRRRSTKVPSS
jgi:hypothetical protein